MGILIRFLRFSFSISIYVVTLNWSVGPDSNRRWPLGRSVMSRVHTAYYVTHRFIVLVFLLYHFSKFYPKFFGLSAEIITVTNRGNPNHKTNDQQNSSNHCTHNSKRYEEVCYRIKFLLVLLYSITNIELRFQSGGFFGKTIVIVLSLAVRSGYYTGTTVDTPVRVSNHVVDIVIFMCPFNECD